MRPRCIGTERAWTQLLFCSVLFYSIFLRNQHWNSFRNKSLPPKIWRRGRVVTLPIRLWDGRFGFRIVGGVKRVFFFIIHNIQFGSGSHLASFTMGTGAVSRGKAFGATNIDSVPRFRMSGAVLCSLSVPSWCGRKQLCLFCVVFSLKL